MDEYDFEMGVSLFQYFIDNSNSQQVPTSASNNSKARVPTTTLMSAMEFDTSNDVPDFNQSNQQESGGKCTHETPCVLCKCGYPAFLNHSPTWAGIMIVVFYGLKSIKPTKQYYSLKNDIYEYILRHWCLLGLDKKKYSKWPKQVQDMLSHNKDIFESGFEMLGQNGHWTVNDKYLNLHPWDPNFTVREKIEKKKETIKIARSKNARVPDTQRSKKFNSL